MIGRGKVIRSQLPEPLYTSKVFWTKPMPFCGKIVIAKLPGSSFFTEIICCLFLIANEKMPKL